MTERRFAFADVFLVGALVVAAACGSALGAASPPSATIAQTGKNSPTLPTNAASASPEKAAAAMEKEPPLQCRRWPIPALAEAQAISADAADRLRLSPGTVRARRPEEFALRDGRLLVQPMPGEEGVLLLPGAAALRRKLLEEELRRLKVHECESFPALRGYIDDGARFAERVPSLVERFQKRLAKGADPSLAITIEKFARRYREESCRPDAAVVEEVTAAVGELARKRFGGSWSTRIEDGAVEPVVVMGSGTLERALVPWQWALRLLDGPEIGVDALVDAAIAAPPLSMTAPSAPAKALP